MARVRVRVINIKINKAFKYFTVGGLNKIVEPATLYPLSIVHRLLPLEVLRKDMWFGSPGRMQDPVSHRAGAPGTAAKIQI